MMELVIIEDEKLAAERLQLLIEKLDPDLRVVQRISSVKKAVEYFSGGARPDLVMMDIQLADGLSFEIFEQVEMLSPVIFTTAYNEYAIKAFKVNSVDYLLKPITEQELGAALRKFRKTAASATTSPQLDRAIRQITQKYKSRFVIKIGDRLVFVPVEQIDCFFSQDKATFLQRNDKRRMAIDYPLDALEELLDPQCFYRVNRKFIIYLHAIRDVVAYSNSRLRLYLNSGEPEEIIVSREKVTAFRDWLDS
jgi:DNA-binding LytR/AlgR family response regulator